MKTIAHWLTRYGLQTTPKNQRLWLLASLVIAILYGILFWRIAFAAPYAISDDGRQHLFWMLRYVDPTLFPDDIIADYFQSVAPAGYKALYWSGAQVGVHPFLLSKLLPPLLGVLGTVYTFYLAIAIIPAPLIAFISTVILNQSLWMWDELASATPKAFNILLIVAFLVYVVRQKLIPCAVVMGLQGLFYPQTIFISVVLLGLRVLWPQPNPQKANARRFLITGLIIATIVLLPYAFETSPYGPVVNLEQARTMVEFQPGSRNAFFYDNPLRYWLFSARSGLLPPVVPVTICAALLLPVLCKLRLPLLKTITSDGAILHQLGLASTIMFLASHSLLFRLHLPSRYSRHSLKIIVALASAMVLVSLLDTGLRRLNRSSLWRQGLSLGLVAIFSVITVGYPTLLNSFLNVVYVKSDRTALYEYLQQQPDNIRIASLAKEAENIPSFTGRSVLGSPCHSLAYHLGYYSHIRPRILDLMAAQYTPELTQLKAVITNYDINFWLIDENSFNPDNLPRQWIRQFEPELAAAVAQLQQQPPALQRLIPGCAVVNDQGKILISAACILKHPSI